MKELENIDDLFSSSLENFEVAPPMEAKKAIEKALDKQLSKKNNKGGWLLLAIISISILATAMFVESKSNKNESQKAKANSKNENKGLTNYNKLKPKAKDAKAISSQSNAISGVTATSKINSNPIHESITSKANNLNQVTASIVKTKQQNKHQKNNIFRSESKSINNLKSSENSDLNNPKLNDKAEENEMMKSQNQEEQILLSASEQARTVEKLNNEIIQENEMPTNKTEVDSSFNEISSTPSAIILEEPKPKAQRYFIAFNVGTGLNANQYGKNNSVSIQELKDSIIFNKPYLSTKFLFGVQHNNLSISSGIGFFKQNEKMKYSYIDKKMQRILVDSIYIDPITSDTIVKHNVPVDTLMDIYRTNEEQTVYNLLQIPIIGNYSYAFAGRFRLDVSAGGAINILLQSKGNYKVSPDGSVSEYQSKTNAPIKAINFTAIAMIGLTYDINNKISMQLAFPFQLGLSNFYKREYFISRKVNSTGVQLGLKYDL
jgi:hypothetical protein